MKSDWNPVKFMNGWTFQSENGTTASRHEKIPSIRWDAAHGLNMEAAEENDKSVSDLKETVQESFNNYQVAGLKTSSYGKS